MCGIAGYFAKSDVALERTQHTLLLMRNRGPNHQASIQIKTDNLCGALLHSRLSIIDLDERSNQPFSINNMTIVFNGEIYNYLELRSELIKKDIQLKTESDTEVLLWYYILYGKDCLSFFEGMWSFAIYNSIEQTLFLSRDRFGEKPLYYVETQDGFYFASEVKFIFSLLGRSLDINYKHALRYLTNGFRSLNKSNEQFYIGLKELPPSHNLNVYNNLKTKKQRYWHPKILVNNEINITDAIEGFRERLLNSIKIRLRSDVPLAFCLSGGVDSAAITSIAAKIHNYNVSTFSIIDKDARYCETNNILATVHDLGCAHYPIELSTENFLPRLKQLILYHDGPIATISYYVHSLLSEQIANKGFKVSLSGTGADELVTGYYDHFLYHLHEIKSQPEFREANQAWETYIKPLIRNPILRNSQNYLASNSFREHIYLDQSSFEDCLLVPFHEDFFEVDYDSSLLKNRMLNEMFHEIVPVILHEDDLNSMYYSIENRSPFLDSHLFDFCYSIPAKYYINNGYAKYILRESMKGILNEQVRLDRHKVGFNASLASLLDFTDQSTKEFLLDRNPVFELVDRKKIESMMNIHPLSDSMNKFLFNFINLRIFLDK
jgi:asparagine synthase (glutamine-hydrolysing)